jgi:hypothetical protein
VEQAYTAIGRAVASAQRFETILIWIFDLYKMVTDDDYLDQWEGEFPPRAMKQRTSDLLKALKAKGHIAPDLEQRLTDYLDDRHTLIHRWMAEHGWPRRDDIAGFTPIIALAHRVQTEANFLTKAFVRYVDKQKLEGVEDLEEYAGKIEKLFQRAHLEGLE